MKENIYFIKNKAVISLENIFQQNLLSLFTNNYMHPIDTTRDASVRRIMLLVEANAKFQILLTLK